MSRLRSAVAGLVLLVMVRLALHGLAGPGPGRFQAFIPAGAGIRPLRELAGLPALWAVGAIGLGIWVVALMAIFGG